MTRLWIEDRLKEVKKRKSDLSKTLDLPPSRVSEIIRGTRRIQSNEIHSLALFLEMDLGSILGLINRETENGPTEKIDPRTEQIVVIGALHRSGNQYDLWPGRDHYTITLPKHTRFPGICKFAFEERLAHSPCKGLHICIQEKDLATAKITGLKRLYDSRVSEKSPSQKTPTDPSKTSKEMTTHDAPLNEGTVAITIGNYQQL